jgi:hypothetical protein
MACLYLARAHLEIPPDLAALVDDPVEAAARYPALARPESILARIMAVLPHQG